MGTEVKPEFLKSLVGKSELEGSFEDLEQPETDATSGEPLKEFIQDERVGTGLTVARLVPGPHGSVLAGVSAARKLSLCQDALAAGDKPVSTIIHGAGAVANAIQIGTEPIPIVGTAANVVGMVAGAGGNKIIELAGEAEDEQPAIAPEFAVAA